MWCIPKIDREFRRRLFELIAVYHRPYDEKLPVVCLDEKLVELRRSVRRGFVHRGVAYRDYEYERRGTANLFIATEPKGGRHFVKITARRTHRDFANFLRDVARRYRKAIAITLVMDNLNTHCEKALIRTFGVKAGRRLWARFRPAYTPVHASWLNQAETALSITSRCVLGTHRFFSIDLLRKQVSRFWRAQTQRKLTFTWKWSKSAAYRWLNVTRTKDVPCPRDVEPPAVARRWH